MAGQRSRRFLLGGVTTVSRLARVLHMATSNTRLANLSQTNSSSLENGLLRIDGGRDSRHSAPQGAVRS